MFFLQVRISHILRFISICEVFTDSPWYYSVSDIRQRAGVVSEVNRPTL
jgi:hypothetical protein